MEHVVKILYRKMYRMFQNPDKLITMKFSLCGTDCSNVPELCVCVELTMLHTDLVMDRGGMVVY